MLSIGVLIVSGAVGGMRAGTRLFLVPALVVVVVGESGRTLLQAGQLSLQLGSRARVSNVVKLLARFCQVTARPIGSVTAPAADDGPTCDVGAHGSAGTPAPSWPIIGPGVR